MARSGTPTSTASVPADLAEIGLADAPADAILMVEWAERWPAMPKRRLDIVLGFGPGDGRQITIEARGPGWQRALRALGVFGAAG